MKFRRGSGHPSYAEVEAPGQDRDIMVVIDPKQSFVISDRRESDQREGFIVPDQRERFLASESSWQKLHFPAGFGTELVLNGRMDSFLKSCDFLFPFSCCSGSFRGQRGNVWVCWTKITAATFSSSQVTSSCLSQSTKGEDSECLQRQSVIFQSGFCVVPTPFSQWNVIFRCHFLIWKIQTEFLTPTPTVIREANREWSVFFIAVYLRAQHVFTRIWISGWFLNFFFTLYNNDKEKTLCMLWRNKQA